MGGAARLILAPNQVFLPAVPLLVLLLCCNDGVAQGASSREGSQLQAPLPTRPVLHFTTVPRTCGARALS